MQSPNEPLHSQSFEVSPKDVVAQLDSGKAIKLIDCRTTEEHAISNIDGSIHVPLNELSSQLELLYKYEDEELVVFCHHGIRSQQAAAILREAGFPNVRSMAGGIDLWSRDIDATIKRY